MPNYNRVQAARRLLLEEKIIEVFKRKKRRMTASEICPILWPASEALVRSVLSDLVEKEILSCRVDTVRRSWGGDRGRRTSQFRAMTYWLNQE